LNGGLFFFPFTFRQMENSMFLFAKPELQQLIKNGQPDEVGKDHIPPAKLFIPGTGCIWLITAIDPEQPFKAQGLYDAGNGIITKGPIDLERIRQSDQGAFIQRDSSFVGKYPLSVYERAARHLGFITDIDILLVKAVPKKPSGPSPD
jgi:hypothetical protein